MKQAINFLSDPPILFSISVIWLYLSLKFPKIFWSKKSILITGIGAGIFFIAGLFDPIFRLIVGKADNVPIVGLIFLVIFFTWLAMWQAINNDTRIKNSEPVAEAVVSPRKVLSWPDLVYIELIAMVIASIVLIVWSILLQAPLEQPANPTVSPNPSKAPWYFLGLQELLVYFDPWIAGVLLPGLCIIGLMIIPYIDKNPKGSGYYSFSERKTAISIFLFGWIILWVLLIIVGTFLRGPNWNFFGPYEYWDVHKLEPLININLSEIIYIKLLGIGLPNSWFLRELFGIGLISVYLFITPLILAKTWFRSTFYKLGSGRYSIFITLLLLMISVPIKMYLRWLFNLKYLIAIPEYFFNI
jgi:hypothetical protein